MHPVVNSFAWVVMRVCGHRSLQIDYAYVRRLGLEGWQQPQHMGPGSSPAGDSKRIEACCSWLPAGSAKQLMACTFFASTSMSDSANPNG